MPDDVPIDVLRLERPGRAPSRRRATRQTSPFVKGPIPLSWISAAARRQGRALHVGLAVWYLAGLTRSLTVELRPSVLRTFGVSRFSSYRALDVLARAGLVNVARQRGRSPVVTVLLAAAKAHDDRATNRGTVPKAVAS